ncbi:hypothetical protein [Streptomyces sp. AC602_WCS936]|uniref:hypothetical protein n=1 Tax=Streptomyces sp. AC602_WCS936 TaxID=2823685 RepID=UPI0027E4F3DB|nr:hypothetical protein [Streptomyces sp. AC602_WCS936]
MWVAAWAVLCAAGIAATAALDTSPAPDPQPDPRSDRREEPVSAECAEYIADVERQLAKAEEEGQDEGLVAFTRTRVGADDCGDELRDHFGGDR